MEAVCMERGGRIKPIKMPVPTAHKRFRAKGKGSR